MSPPPAASHGRYQFRIGHLVREKMALGEVITECPISTADGVRAADVAWASNARMGELGNRSCFPHAPEICIDVLPPRNSRAELQEKMALYFDAGAHEVWTCSEAGEMAFYTRPSGARITCSELCAEFPSRF